MAYIVELDDGRLGLFNSAPDEILSKEEYQARVEAEAAEKARKERIEQLTKQRAEIDAELNQLQPRAPTLTQPQVAVQTQPQTQMHQDGTTPQDGQNIFKRKW